MTHCEMTDKSKPSSQSISQLFIAILRPGLLHRFLLQLNLSAGLCQLFTFLKVSPPPCVLSTIPKAIPCNLSSKCKRKVTSVRLSGCNILAISLQCQCLLDIFAVHLAKQLWKSPLVFFLFSSLIFLPLALGIWTSHHTKCAVKLD